MSKKNKPAPAASAPKAAPPEYGPPAEQTPPTTSQTEGAPSGDASSGQPAEQTPPTAPAASTEAAASGDAPVGPNAPELTAAELHGDDTVTGVTKLPEVTPLTASIERRAHGVGLPPPGEYSGYAGSEYQIRPEHLNGVMKLAGALQREGVKLHGQPVLGTQAALDWLLEQVVKSYDGE